jgi:hypothetical protein
MRNPPIFAEARGNENHVDEKEAHGITDIRLSLTLFMNSIVAC